jgi:hypothetical protein
VQLKFHVVCDFVGFSNRLALEDEIHSPEMSVSKQLISRDDSEHGSIQLRVLFVIKCVHRRFILDCFFFFFVEKTTEETLSK